MSCDRAGAECRKTLCRISRAPLATSAVRRQHSLGPNPHLEQLAKRDSHPVADPENLCSVRGCVRRDAGARVNTPYEGSDNLINGLSGRFRRLHGVLHSYLSSRSFTFGVHPEAGVLVVAAPRSPNAATDLLSQRNRIPEPRPVPARLRQPSQPSAKRTYSAGSSCSRECIPRAARFQEGSCVAFLTFCS